MHVYVDRSVIEAYVDGKKSLTTRVYPTLADAVGLRVLGDAKVKVKSLEVWNLDGAFGAVTPSHFDEPSATPQGAEGFPTATSPRATSPAGRSSTATRSATPP